MASSGHTLHDNPPTSGPPISGAAGDPVRSGCRPGPSVDRPRADRPALFTSSSTAVKPNLMFVLDDSGSYGQRPPARRGRTSCAHKFRQRSARSASATQPTTPRSATCLRSTLRERLPPTRVHVDPEQQSERPDDEPAHLRFGVVADRSSPAGSITVDFRAARRRQNGWYANAAASVTVFSSTDTSLAPWKAW